MVDKNCKKTIVTICGRKRQRDIYEVTEISSDSQTTENSPIKNVTRDQSGTSDSDQEHPTVTEHKEAVDEGTEIKDGSGLIKDGSGLIKDGSGLIKDGSGLINVAGLLTETKMSKAYDVNGERFIEDEDYCACDDNTLFHYELYREETDMDEGCEENDLITELEYTTQIVSQGLIINSNVFLSEAQWNTFCLVDGDFYRCAVCLIYCDRASFSDHIGTLKHRRNLDTFRPLKRFDLSVVRKIYESMHCGVCNEIFDIIDYVTHENSKSHGENLLRAINKVSDDFVSNEKNYRDNSPDTRTDEYHFDANAINNNVTPDRDYRNNNNEFHFDANTFNSISVYEEYSDNDEDEEEYAYEGDEYSTPYQGVSYASMASKPSIELPKFLKIDLGTKEVRVKFESWHMITKIKLNQFYCMVCNKPDHIRFKSQHCIGCDHLERLARCTVVGAFEDYLIRKVNDKLYHCGHCNNLHYQNQMNEHIERAHPKKNKNIIDTSASVTNSPVKTIKKIKSATEKTNKNATETKPKTEPVEQKTEPGELKTEPVEPKVFDIFGDMVLCPFGTTITVSALSFNLIMKRDDEYYCAVCDEVCADVLKHVQGLEHVEVMNYTPFIKPFKCNLTRAVRGTLLHCTLCNQLIQVHKIYSHNMDQPHTNALATALGMKKTQKPDNTYHNHQTDYNYTGSDLSKARLVPLRDPPAQSKDTYRMLHVSESSNGSTPLASPKANKREQIGFLPSNFSPSSSGRNTPAGLNAGCTGRLNPAQNHQNFAVTNNQFPSLPVKSASLNAQFLGAPLAYTNFNAPRAPFPPFPYVSGPNQFANTTHNGNANRNPSPVPKQNVIPTIETKKNTPEAKIEAQPKRNVIDTTNIIKTGNNARKDNIKPVYNIKAVNNTKAVNNIRATNVNIKATNDNIKATNDNIKATNDNIKAINDNIKATNDNIKVADVSIEYLNDSLDSVESEAEECKVFDEEELVLLKNKTAYFKISNVSYNTLVYWGNGLRHCFVCSNTLSTSVLQKHVESREHTDNIAKTKFLDKYGKQLLRQMYLMYHCSICNVLMTRKEIKMHLDWATHVECYNAAYKVLNKKNRKELKSGIKEYIVETQKEAIFNNVNEPKYNIINGYKIVPNLEIERNTLETKPVEGSKPTVSKKNKMVIVNNVVMKVAFDHWHGIVTSKNVTRCVICQLEIGAGEVLEHVGTKYHNVSLGMTFEHVFYPALVRKINEHTVNCVICNLELLNDDCMIKEHVNGRKHIKNHETIVKESSNSASYADCYEDHLSL